MWWPAHRADPAAMRWRGVSGTPSGTGTGTIQAGDGGSTYGQADFSGVVSGASSISLGSGGGGSAAASCGYQPSGMAGGGIVMIYSSSITVLGKIIADGKPFTSLSCAGNSGGPGAGGSVYLRANSLTLGIGFVTAAGGTSDTQTGSGSAGRIQLDYQTLSGTTTPAARSNHYWHRDLLSAAKRSRFAG